MNVAILTSCANNDRYIGAIRVSSIRNALRKNGDNYVVYTSDTSVNENQYKVFQDSVGKIDESIGLFSLPLKVARKLWYSAFGITSHPLYNAIIESVIIDHGHRAIDVIFATSPQAEMLEAAAYLSSKIQVPLVSDLRDGLIFEPLKKLNVIDLFI